MAEENLKSTEQQAEFGPARKPAVYDYLGRLNAAFARVHKNLELLGQVSIFDPEAMARLKNASDTLQADANYTLIDALRGIEKRDRAAFRKQQS